MTRRLKVGGSYLCRGEHCHREVTQAVGLAICGSEEEGVWTLSWVCGTESAVQQLETALAVAVQPSVCK
jgi:hypothetical protein